LPPLFESAIIVADKYCASKTETKNPKSLYSASLIFLKISSL